MMSVERARDLEALQIRRGHGHHAEAAGRKIFGHADQPRLANAVHVDARHQRHRAPLAAGGRPIHARVHRAVPRRDLSDRFGDERLRAPVRQPVRDSRPCRPRAR